MQRGPSSYVFDPADPRAPSHEQWEAMTEAERAEVVATLPAEVPIEVMAPEGDLHRTAKWGAIDALDGFFRRIGRKVYLSSELAVFYPDEARIVPDVLAVVDVENHPRMKWVVEDEKKGIDFVLEVHVAGDARKDHEKNVERYARLGIPEYFIFDRGRLRLTAYRIGERARYQPIVPQGGRFASNVLGLELIIEGDRLRFLYGGAALPEADEMISRLDKMLNEVVAHKEEAERAAQDAERAAREAQHAGTAERERADAERERADKLAAELAEARAEIERLKRR